MKGYWIARIEVTDAERYGQYAKALPAVVARFNGRFVVVGGRMEVAEGGSRPRNVVVEFPDFDTAKACWHSDDYAKVAKLRDGAAVVDVVIAEGMA